MKEKIQTLSLEWISWNNTISDASICITDTSRDEIIFEGLIPISPDGFFYTISEDVYDQTSGNDFLKLELAMHDDWMYSPDSKPEIGLTTCLIKYDTSGQLHIDTSNSVTLTANTDTIDTSNVIYLDRTEFYGSGGAEIFWDDNDVSEVTDVTNAQYIYSSEMRDESCVFPAQLSGYLKVKRVAVTDYEGVDGTVRIDTSVFSEYYGQHLGVYISANDTSAGEYLGDITSLDAKYALTRNRFGVSTGLMQTMSDASFAGMTLSIANDHTTESTWMIYDSVFEYSRLVKDTVDTSNEALVTDSTVPTIWASIETQHKARIKKGAYYVIEYYTPNEWWDFDG